MSDSAAQGRAGAEKVYVVVVEAEIRVPATAGDYSAAMDAALELLPGESEQFQVMAMSIKRASQELWA